MTRETPRDESPYRGDGWETHQEDDIGMLVEGSGHTDSLALTTRQVDALLPKGRRSHSLIALQERLFWPLLNRELFGIEA